MFQVLAPPPPLPMVMVSPLSLGWGGRMQILYREYIIAGASK